jgi:NADH-quinone oxidoreductase subunit I/electron transport complex protein RnfC
MAIERGEVITVERGARRQRLPGAGLLASMAVVWKHWQASFRKNDSFSKIHGTFTMEYPDERPQLPEAYRNMPILLYDEASGHELCTSCFQCQRICPPQVIHMTQAKDPTTGKAVPAVAEFVIEYDACMSCGFCAEVCPFDAIKMDHAFELATADHAGLTLDKQQLNRPIGYFAGIAPAHWAEVEAGAMKKLQGNIKRRPDVLGMAPNLAERIAARRRELEAVVVEPAARETGDRRQGEVSAVASAEDKAAKLAAIRAKNAAKAADAAPVSIAPAEAPPAEAPPQDEKAARLAAIRAKNAVRQAASGDGPAPTAAAPVEPPSVPPSTEPPPQDEKAARLAAIRARNAAKKVAEGEEGA